MSRLKRTSTRVSQVRIILYASCWPEGECTTMDALPPLNSAERARISLIAESYLRLSGQPLVDTHGDVIDALWRSPVCIVAHDTADDPVFFFGNATALALFELDFTSFTKLPSRYSAEPLLREERARLLERVNRDGLIDDYAGVRVSSTGKRFRIARASVWNLIDEGGARHGQAAAFSDWTPIGP